MVFITTLARLSYLCLKADWKGQAESRVACRPHRELRGLLEQHHRKSVEHREWRNQLDPREWVLAR